MKKHKKQGKKPTSDKRKSFIEILSIVIDLITFIILILTVLGWIKSD